MIGDLISNNKRSDKEGKYLFGLLCFSLFAQDAHEYEIVILPVAVGVGTEPPFCHKTTRHARLWAVCPLNSPSPCL